MTCDFLIEVCKTMTRYIGFLPALQYFLIWMRWKCKTAREDYLMHISTATARSAEDAGSVSASYGQSQWTALDQRLLCASSETLAGYCASDSIKASSTQDQRKSRYWATWPDQSKGTQHHIALSPQFAQDWGIETSTIRRTKRIIKNSQQRSKRKANHMTLTKALASACFPPLPSQKHLVVLLRQARFGRSRAKIYCSVKWQQDCTALYITKHDAKQTTQIHSNPTYSNPKSSTALTWTVACASRVCLVENHKTSEILCISNLRPKIQAKSFSSVAVMPSSSRIHANLKCNQTMTSWEGKPSEHRQTVSKQTYGICIPYYESNLSRAV